MLIMLKVVERDQRGILKKCNADQIFVRSAPLSARVAVFSSIARDTCNMTSLHIYISIKFVFVT